MCTGIDKNKTRFTYFLGKESTVRYKGINIKDITYLKRDLGNIIVIDFKEENCAKQLSNLILLKKYEGDENDTQLNYLIPFLKGNY
jgi:TFIIF-interacting CTD phosphatase-like protein